MDRYERTLGIVTALNSFNHGTMPRYEFLDQVCDYFDFIKNEDLNDADKKFLLYISNKAGIPQYYDILHKFNNKYFPQINDENIGLDTISSLLYESSLYVDENSKLHHYQMEILNLFKPEKLNRFFLSASTSFGKTHLVYEIIKKLRYKNVVLIFPSIALLTENLAKIKENKIIFSVNYKIHTLSDVDSNFEENNLFIFTPERFLSFIDKNGFNISFDFIFVDEVYKIDNGYIIDNEQKENERDVSYRMAIFYGLTKYTKIDVFLAGPYIEIFNENSKDYNPSFDLFLNTFKIQKLLRNEYEIVKINKSQIEETNGKTIIDGINFDFTKKKNKKSRIQELLDKLYNENENTIVYCNTKANAEKVANDYVRENIETTLFTNFIEHLKSNYDNSWIIITALEKGVGVHHGVVPKYIQKELVSLFNSNDSGVNILVSTTTITEGVNTTAKNMIVYKSEKGSGINGKPLLVFDAKNIAGRAGRFMVHYKGRVISLDKEFIERINEKGIQIEHKNFQLDPNRKEVDDEMTPREFLDDRSIQRLNEIRNLQLNRGIPDDIISQFKIISKRDKIKIYDLIAHLPTSSLFKIKILISALNSPKIFIDKEGLQVVLDIINNIIENDNLKQHIENTYIDKYSNIEYSILIASLSSYLSKGFNGVFEYYLKREKNKKNKNSVNAAMRQSSNLIFNTFKYQLVKYLGVFNLMYKFRESQRQSIKFEDVPGIDMLIVKLEYNAFSENARIASDYGVPQKIIDFYDSKNEPESKIIYNSFDNYEKQIYEKMKLIIEK